MTLIDNLFVIAVIVMSAVIHEVMHGVAAERLGDPTARLQGRITLNPVSHIDLLGSIILPAILVLTHAPVLFGWAKPVPYNPYNLRPGKWSEAIVAAAGPLSNLGIALVAGILIRTGIFAADVNDIFFIIVLINVMLFFFNLIPVPPLDGSKVLTAILPSGLAIQYERLRSYMEWNPFLGFGVVMLIVLAAGGAFTGLIWSVAGLIAGA